MKFEKKSGCSFFVIDFNILRTNGILDNTKGGKKVMRKINTYL